MFGMADGELTREMGERLRTWLDGPAGSARLVDWLQGYGLPPVGYADEPYLWLLRGMGAIGDERSAKAPDRTYDDLFCEQVAALLLARPDVNRPGARPEQVLYNLFLLCAGLRCPGCLADPLYAIFQGEKLTGSWLGVDLRTTLRSALAENQVHERLRRVWLAMIRGEIAFLPGDEESGFAGLLMMPEAPGARGEPAVRAVGDGLTALIRRLESDEHARARLVEMIDSVHDTFPDYDGWNDRLIEFAHRDEWPAWALSTLPPLSAATDRREEYHVWRVIADCVRHVPGIRSVGVTSLCQDYIDRLHVSGSDAIDRLRQIAGRIDRMLSEKKDLRFRSVLCYINQTMMEFEDDAQDTEHRVEEARRGLLERSQVLTGAR
jgi:hypothetical protein